MVGGGGSCETGGNSLQVWGFCSAEIKGQLQTLCSGVILRTRTTGLDRTRLALLSRSFPLTPDPADSHVIERDFGGKTEARRRRSPSAGVSGFHCV